MAVLIQFRRDTSANWTAANPTLSDGEFGLETDTLLYKIGDGSSNWITLGYPSLSGEFGALLLDGQSADPSPPAADKMLLYAKSIAGRMMTRQMGPSGLSTFLQPLLARNKIGYWCPPGNATTVPGVLGFTAFTAVTAATARNIAATNFFTRMRRLGYPSAAGAGSLAGARVAVAQITLGDGSGLGGFYKIIRWGISDASFTSACRTFIGISSATGAPSNVEPSTLTNVIGMGHGASDTTMRIYYGGSAAQTPIDLGSDFPADTSTVDAYELALFSSADDNTQVIYEVTRLNTGHVATGVLTNTTPGTTLPASSTLLTYSQNWRSNNANAVAVAFDIMSDYIETDS